MTTPYNYPDTVKTRWRKSTKSSSNGNAGQCVETRLAAGQFQLRDSKLDSQSPLITISAIELSSLLAMLK